MVYTCDNCGCIFSRPPETDRCPDCGKRMVRPANQVEHSEFTHRMAELIHSHCSEKPRFPNLVETAISNLNVFAFRLPATALQIDSRMIVDILVEYGENSADENELTANVWARQVDGLSVSFLMPVHLPAIEGETQRGQVNRLFASLSSNSTFQATLYDFIMKQLEHGDRTRS